LSRDRRSLDGPGSAPHAGRVDRTSLADFLRRRREALQPADVGLPVGLRRRTAGLRREEVAALTGMSTDYYTRLEQRRGPQPSEQMLTALARGLRLTLDERDHLFRLAGHGTPGRVRRTEHVPPGVMRVLDRLADTPAQVVTDLGVTLVQNQLAVALLGDQTSHDGPARSAYHRWFLGDPAEREHAAQSRLWAADLRAATGRGTPGADALVTQLLAASPEFAEVGLGTPRGRRPQRAAQDPRPPRTRRDRARLPGAAQRGPRAAPARVHRDAGHGRRRPARAAGGRGPPVQRLMTGAATPSRHGGGMQSVSAQTTQTLLPD